MHTKLTWLFVLTLLLTAFGGSITFQDNTEAPAGSAWIEDTGLHWADGTTEYSLPQLQTKTITTGGSSTERIAEAGSTSGLFGDRSISVSFETAFDETPYVFATTQTTNGGDNPSQAHVWGVDTSGFTTQHCEVELPDGCDSHAEETNGWIAISPSKVQQVEGMDAGETTIQDNDILDVSFNKEFENTPIILAQIQTNNGEVPRNVRVGNRNTNGFDIELCEQDGTDSCDSSHAQETVAWWAIDPTTASKGTAFDWGTLSFGNSNWQSVSFSQSYSSTPILLGMTQTLVGQSAHYPESDNVDTSGGSVRFCEYDGSGNCDNHGTRTFGWFSAAQESNIEASVPTTMEKEREEGTAYYRFDSGSGQEAANAADYSLNGTLGSSSSSETNDPTWTTGKFGQALSFDGNDDYVTVQNDNSLDFSLQDRTVSAWIQVPSDISGGNGNNRMILSKFPSGGGGEPSWRFHVDKSDGVVTLYIESSTNADGTAVVGSSDLRDNQWHHVAAVRDRSADRIRLYVDGELVSSVVDGDQDASNDGELFIGEVGSNPASGLGWEGDIDEVRIYDRALSSNEIQRLYQGVGANVSGSKGSWWIEDSAMHWIDQQGYERAEQAPKKDEIDSPDEQAAYSFDEGEGQIAYDSAQGNNGILGGTTASESSDPTWITGKISGALSFDGNDDVVDVGNPTALQIDSSLTICFWVNPNNLGAQRENPIDKAYGGEFSFTFEDSNDDSPGTLNTYFGSDGSDNTPYARNEWTDVAQNNEWTHLCWVRDNQNQDVTLYKNATDWSSSQTNTEWETPTTGSQPVEIGSGYTNTFNGSIDDVRIYDRPLSQHEVQELYNKKDESANSLPAGHTWLENGMIHYIDQDGNKRQFTGIIFLDETYESQSIGSFPEGWQRDTDWLSSNPIFEIDDTTAKTGSKAVYSTEDSQGSPKYVLRAFKNLDKIYQPSHIQVSIYPDGHRDPGGAGVRFASNTITDDTGDPENPNIVFDAYFSPGGNNDNDLSITGLSSDLSINLDQWYTVEWRNIDWNTGTMDVYLDGTLQQEDASFTTPSSGGIAALHHQNDDKYFGFDDIQLRK